MERNRITRFESIAMGSLCRLFILSSALCAFGILSSSRSSADVAGRMAANAILLARRGGDGMLQAAVFAKKLKPNQEPDTPSETFTPNESVCLSLRYKGRPAKGIAEAKFYLGTQLISDAKVDFATVNKGVFFSVGQNTYAGFTLKPSRPFPISSEYRAETFLDGKATGVYRFKVVPGGNAIPSKILEATLSKDVNAQRAPVGPTTVFAPDQKVCLAVRGDMGNGTGIEVNWYVNGRLDSAGTKSITFTNNVPNTRFFFTFRPAGGWKKGKQEVVLTMNGAEAGRYAFTVK